MKSLTEMHGGTMEAHSEGAGKGSEFVVRLPVLPMPQPPEVGIAGTDAPGPSPPRRVLVVDDNEDAADSLAMLLRLGGHEVRKSQEAGFDGHLVKPVDLVQRQGLFGSPARG